MKFMTPAFRVSIGLIFLMISVLLAADLLGIMPDTSKAELENRKKFIETLAIQISFSAENNGIESVSELISAIQARYDNVNSVALRKVNGNILSSAGDHESFWSLPEGNKSSATQVRVPLYAESSKWGTVEISFVPLQKNNRFGFAISPVYEMVLFVAFVGFIVFFLFMKRTLQHLDPSSVIPERVKSAFDTLTEGLVLMDEKERIVLTNTAFSNKVGKPVSELLGKKVSELNWALSRKEDDNFIFPWQETLRDIVQNTGKALKFNTPEGLRSLTVNSSPILDGNGKQRGALATFDDVTTLEQKNSQLKRAMYELNISKQEIEKNNEQLTLLATTDSLTGCLNRRAFFDIFDKVFEDARANGEEICSIMADIDHFKTVNDDFGHGAGDVVIQKMAQALLSSVREEDVVCRYGGEEFCILMPGISINDAAQIAERIRTSITSIIDEEVDVIPGRIITASLGITSSYLGAEDPTLLVDQADLALYVSKENGRDQVTRYDEMEMETEPA